MTGVVSKTSPGHRPSSYEALCPDTDRKCYLAVTWGIRAFAVYACLGRLLGIISGKALIPVFQLLHVATHWF